MNVVCLAYWKRLC